MLQRYDIDRYRVQLDETQQRLLDTAYLLVHLILQGAVANISLHAGRSNALEYV
jgi:hypothetical protein